MEEFRYAWSKPIGDSKVTTLYVDNLSDDMDVEWLGQIFSKFGRLMDIFIPRKRSKYYKSKFGFVRFDRAEDAYEAIDSLNGISIRDKKMLVKVATFCAGLGTGGLQSCQSKHEYKVSKGKEVDGEAKLNAKYTNSGWGKSFVDVVKGKPIAGPKRISVKPIGNEWLSRSAVAKLKSLSAMECVREVLHCKGVSGIDVKDMGGLWVVLTFSSVAQLQSVFGGDLSWLSGWFTEIKKWSPDIENARRRNVWISCYGVPLHGWSAATFHRIAQLWGEVIGSDDATIKGLSFAAGKVMISTERWDCINETIQVEVQGKIYLVRVVEEQVVIQGHCSVCNFSPAESYKGEGNSVNDSVDEANSRRDAEDAAREDRQINSRLDNSIVDASVENLSDGADACMNDSDKECFEEGEVRESVPHLTKGSACVKKGCSLLTSNPKTDSLEEGEFRKGEPHNVSNEGGSFKQVELGPNQIGEENRVFDGKGSISIGDVDALAAEKLQDNSDDSLLGDSSEDIESFEDIAAARELGNTCENIEEVADTEVRANKEFDEAASHSNAIQMPFQATIKGIKGKKHRKSINEILGYSKVNAGDIKGKMNKKKCVVLRSAVASAALSASISSRDINNRNRILLDEAQAIWEVDKLFGLSYDGDENEVISKIAEMEATNKARAVHNL